MFVPTQRRKVLDIINLLVQFTPSPENPMSQVQVKFPSVFIQVAFG